MSDGLEVLSILINSEITRFETIQGNIFTRSFSEISRYYNFLQIIHNRYQSMVQKYSKIFEEFKETIDKCPGPHRFTNEQTKLDIEMTQAGIEVQLEIESFYQFAKILLDKTAYTIEYYFGFREKKAQRISGHHFMVEDFNNSGILKIEDYCQAKGLKISKDLIEKMKNLQTDISNFRDDAITHLSNPRTIRGTSIEGTMSLGKIYPKDESDSVWKASKALGEILKSIEEYISLVAEFISINHDKTNLTLKA